MRQEVRTKLQVDLKSFFATHPTPISGLGFRNLGRVAANVSGPCYALT